MKWDCYYVKAFHLFLPLKYFEPSMNIVLRCCILEVCFRVAVCCGTSSYRAPGAEEIIFENEFKQNSHHCGNPHTKEE